MKKSMLRPFGWFCILGLLFTASDQMALPLILAEMLVLTLGMPEALRRGLAKCASRTRVIGMTITALLLTALLTAAATVAVHFGALDYRLLLFPAGWTEILTEVVALRSSVLSCMLSAGAIIGVRCMEEYFCADGDNTSAILLDVLTAIAVYATAMIDGLNPLTLCVVLMCVLLLGIAVALITGRKYARAGEKLHPEFVPLMREVPVALLRVGLYPAIMIFCLAVSNLFAERISGHFILMTTFGMLLVEMFRSTFRRDAREAAGYVLLVTHIPLLLAVVLAVVQLYIGETGAYGIVCGLFIYAAAGVLMLLYAPLNWRMLLSGALLLAAAAASLLLGGTTASIAVGVPALVSALLMIPEWRELVRIQRVKRIRARAMRKR